jgi:tetratricopeptide (TPR) repeat protein
MRCVSWVILMALTVTPCANAQGVTDHMVAGDRLFAVRDARGALREYELAIAANPVNYDALVKASRSAVDLGEFEPDARERTAFFTRGRKHAEGAVAVNPRGADGHYVLAAATGRAALAVGSRERINYGKIVRNEALASLAIAPNHAGALHVMGMWNAEVMRLPGVLRFIARKFLGGEVFSEASWELAERYLERAVAAEPNRIVHHLDLGMILRDRGKTEAARAQFDWIARAAITDFNDPHYKLQAAAERRKM